MDVYASQKIKCTVKTVGSLILLMFYSSLIDFYYIAPYIHNTLSQLKFLVKSKSVNAKLIQKIFIYINTMMLDAMVFFNGFNRAVIKDVKLHLSGDSILNERLFLNLSGAVNSNEIIKMCRDYSGSQTFNKLIKSEKIKPKVKSDVKVREPKQYGDDIRLEKKEGSLIKFLSYKKAAKRNIFLGKEMNIKDFMEYQDDYIKNVEKMKIIEDEGKDNISDVFNFINNVTNTDKDNEAKIKELSFWTENDDNKDNNENKNAGEVELTFGFDFDFDESNNKDKKGEEKNDKKKNIEDIFDFVNEQTKSKDNKADKKEEKKNDLLFDFSNKNDKKENKTQIVKPKANENNTQINKKKENNNNNIDQFFQFESNKKSKTEIKNKNNNNTNNINNNNKNQNQVFDFFDFGKQNQNNQNNQNNKNQNIQNNLNQKNINQNQNNMNQNKQNNNIMQNNQSQNAFNFSKNQFNNPQYQGNQPNNNSKNQNNTNNNNTNKQFNNNAFNFDNFKNMNNNNIQNNSNSLKGFNNMINANNNNNNINKPFNFANNPMNNNINNNNINNNNINKNNQPVNNTNSSNNKNDNLNNLLANFNFPNSQNNSNNTSMVQFIPSFPPNNNNNTNNSNNNNFNFNFSAQVTNNAFNSNNLALFSNSGLNNNNKLNFSGFGNNNMLAQFAKQPEIFVDLKEQVCFFYHFTTGNKILNATSKGYLGLMTESDNVKNKDFDILFKTEKIRDQQYIQNNFDQKMKKINDFSYKIHLDNVQKNEKLLNYIINPNILAQNRILEPLIGGENNTLRYKFMYNNNIKKEVRKIELNILYKNVLQNGNMNKSDGKITTNNNNQIIVEHNNRINEGYIEFPLNINVFALVGKITIIVHLKEDVISEMNVEIKDNYQKILTIKKDAQISYEFS